MTQFNFLGRLYRTNADASVVQGLDGSTWNTTFSARVITEAKRVLGI